MEEIITTFQDLFAGLFAGMSTLAIISLVVFCGLLALLFVYFIRIHIAYRMAVNRHRDPLGWALLSFFVSPLLTWIILRKSIRKGVALVLKSARKSVKPIKKSV